MKITRRHLLLGGASAAAIAVVGMAGNAVGFPKGVEAFSVGFLKRALPTIKVEDLAYESFVRDYLSVTEDKSRIARLAQLGMVVGYDGLELLLGGTRPYKTFKRRIATAFLLSSDYFLTEARPVVTKYLAYSPGCANPCARFNP